MQGDERRRDGARLELEQGMAAALELLARARGALARGDLPDLGRLIALLESLRGALERPPAVDDRRLRRALLGLLDEAGIVAEQLREEQATAGLPVARGGRASACRRRLPPRRQALRRPAHGPVRLSALPRGAGLRSRSDRAAGMGGPPVPHRQPGAKGGAAAGGDRDPADRPAAKVVLARCDGRDYLLLLGQDGNRLLERWPGTTAEPPATTGGERP